MARRQSVKTTETLADSINLAALDPAIVAAIEAKMKAEAAAASLPVVQTPPTSEGVKEAAPFDLLSVVVGQGADKAPITFNPNGMVTALFSAGAHIAAAAEEKGTVTQGLFLAIDYAFAHAGRVSDVMLAVVVILGAACEKAKSRGALNASWKVDGLEVANGTWKLDLGRGADKGTKRAVNTLNSYLSSVRAAFAKGLRPRMKVEVPQLNPKTGAVTPKLVNPFATIGDCRKASAEVSHAMERAEAARVAALPENKRAHLAEGYAQRIVKVIRATPDANLGEALVQAIAAVAAQVDRLTGPKA